MDKPQSLIDSLNKDIQALPYFGNTHLSEEDIKTQYGVENVYRMYMNESAYGPSPKVVEVLQQESALVGEYPLMRDDPLREKLAQTLGHGLDKDNFFTACSGYEILDIIFRTMVRPDDEVIVMHPTFTVYNRLIRLAQAKMVDVPLNEHTFMPDIDAVLNAITDKTRMVMVCNPNNPTGTVMPKAEMDKLVHNVPDHVLILTDEVYYHYVTDPDYPDSIQYVLDNRNVVIIHTFSKSYGLAGLRIGYGITTPTLAQYIHRFYRGFHLNRLQIAASLAALDDPDHVQKNVSASVEGREYIFGRLDALDLHYWRGQGNFILIELPCPADDVRQKLLEQGVIVSAIGAQYPNYLRVSVTTPEANEAFANGLEKALREIL